MGRGGRDAELAARALRGDEEAWSRVVELHWVAVWRLARLLVRDTQGAEDVVLETFATVRRTLAGYRGKGPLAGWIQAICRGVALDTLGRRARRGCEQSVEHLPDSVALPGSIDRDARADVERALAALADDEREALLLQVAGFGAREVAELLGVAETTIRSRRARAREHLLPLLEGYRGRTR